MVDLNDLLLLVNGKEIGDFPCVQEAINVFKK